MKSRLVIVVIAMLGTVLAQTGKPAKTDSLIDRVRKGDDSALREMEKKGDIQDLKILLHDPHYANRGYVRGLLAKMGDRESLQYYACRSLTDDILQIEDLTRQELDGIGGDFTVEVYRRLLDSDPRFRPQLERIIEQMRKSGGDSWPQLPSVYVIPRLSKLLPDAPIPALQPLDIQAHPGVEEEFKSKWRMWIDSHQAELEKLKPSPEGINFNPDHFAADNAVSKH